MATLYLVVGEAQCWDCGAAVLTPGFRVVGWQDETALQLAGPTAKDDMLLLPYAVDPPATALRASQALQSGYGLHYARTAAESYCMTRCGDCGAPQGDYYLHKPGDGPFFPLGDADARDVYLLELEAFSNDAFWGEAAAGVEPKILRQGTHCVNIAELLVTSRLLTRTKDILASAVNSLVGRFLQDPVRHSDCDGGIAA